MSGLLVEMLEGVTQLVDVGGAGVPEEERGLLHDCCRDSLLLLAEV